MDQIAVTRTAAGSLPGTIHTGLFKTLLGFSGDTLLLTVLTFGVTSVALLPLIVAKADLQKHELLVMVLSFVAMALAALPLWLRTRRLPVLHAIVSFDRSLWLGVAIGIAAFVFSAIKAMVQTQWLGDQPEPSNVAPIQTALASQPWLAMTTFVVLGPLVEELLLRRVLLGRMIARGWPWLGAVLTTVLFAWLHEPVPGDGVHVLQWLWLLAGYATLGAMFAWVYWRTRRWAAAFVAHASNNLIACSLLWFGIG